MESTTVAAIATPLVTGGIGIVRISGPDAITIADKVFRGSRKLCDLKGYEACFGHVYSGEEKLDECVALVFRAPRSFTGENVAELSCHGGVYVVQQVLSAVLQAGALPAGAGEFTRRAFYNGKIDLTKAEAIADIISADGKAALAAAVSMKDGALYKLCGDIAGRLTTLLGSLAAWADFPDEDIPFVDDDDIAQTLLHAKSALEKLEETYPAVTAVKGGVSVAVAGKPNAGKSSLLNRLCGKDRSIVTHIAGTTRDVVEETVEVGGITLRLFDTAGIRDTDDEIEAMGVQRSRRAIETSDLVLFVADGGKPMDEEDKEILAAIGDKPCICVLNKSDLPQMVEASQFGDHPAVQISAATGDGMEELTAQLTNLLKAYAFDPSAPLIANARQLACVKGALAAVEQAQLDLRFGQTYDIITVSIESALEHLLTLTGQQVSETIIDDVFSRFCVGK